MMCTFKEGEILYSLPCISYVDVFERHIFSDWGNFSLMLMAQVAVMPFYRKKMQNHIRFNSPVH